MLIGIDWGGTKIEGIAMQPDGTELVRMREFTPRHDYDGCLKLVRNLVDRMENETGQTGSVGIGIPGSLDPITRMGKGASSTWLLGRPVEQDLRQVLEREVRVENDADCFAASEAFDGAGAGHNVVFAVILGSGAGAGVAVGGKAHHGPNNTGGEWGHNALPFPTVSEIPGKDCYCGRQGCMETWVSGRAFEASYKSHTGEDLKARDIMEKKRNGDHLSNLLWDRYIDRVARGLAPVVNILDPDVFVFGGGISNIEELLQDLPAQLAKRTFTTAFNTPMLKAVHGDSSGVRGAARLWS